MKCPNCNSSDHELGAKFCHVCGWPLSVSSAEQPKSGNSPKIDIPPKRTFTINGVSFNMILVEGGTFMMGAQNEDPSMPNFDPEAYPLFESPVHQETIKSFYIGEVPVTMALWKAVSRDRSIENKGYTHVKFDTVPAFPLTLAQCHALCSELMAQTGEYFRLPTEIEWEFAARGGIKSNNYRFSGSNILPDVGWYYNNMPNGQGTTEEFRFVKQKRPNELGLYDMSGLIWEWCEEGMDYHSRKKLLDKVICRGGSWYSRPSDCRVSKRELLGRDYYNRLDTMRYPGMRLAMSPRNM